VSIELVRAHYDQYLGVDGPPVEVRPAGPVRILRYASPSLGFNSFATLGLSESEISAIYPQELVCSVLPGQDGAADFLLRKCVEIILGRAQGFVIDDIVPNSQPLLANTDIYGVLTGGHPYLPEEFDVVHNAAGDVDATPITLIPITLDEIQIARSGEISDLLDALETAQSNLVDVARSSARP
jgi:hypothetical protein